MRADVSDIKKYIGNALFFVYTLIIIIDPTNTITHLKDVAFILLVGYSAAVYKPEIRNAIFLLLVFCPFLFGFISAQMQMNVMGDDEMLAALKGVAPFVLLLWVKYYDVVRLSIIPSIIAAVAMIVLYLVVTLVDNAEYLVYMFTKSHNEMLMLTTRHFYGIKIFGIYCNSLYCLLFALMTTYYRLFFSGRKRWLYIVCALLLTFPFVVGGTRSIMLLPFIVLGVVAYVRYSQAGFVRYLVYPLMVIFVFAVIFVIYMLASEDGQQSNDMKYGHLVSYVELFSNHPDYLVLGQGPGTFFYTKGFGRMTAQTEWSYIELVRYYGISCLLILLVFLYPLRTMYQNRSIRYVAVSMWVYAIYLLVAGTNPLLTTSTGTFVLLCAFSICSRCRNQRETKETEP